MSLLGGGCGSSRFDGRLSIERERKLVDDGIGEQQVRFAGAGGQLELERTEHTVVLDDQGQPLAFKLLDDGERFAESPGPFGRFEHLIEGNLAPFIEALGRYAGVAPKVLWSNAGNYFEAVFGQLANRASQAQLADGQALVDARHLADGRRNPLYQPVRYVELANADGRSRTWRQRRLCCIRYLLDGVALCPNCPRLDAPPQ